MAYEPPAHPETPEEAEATYHTDEWRAAYHVERRTRADRDRALLAAVQDGTSRRRLHRLTRLPASTIDRIVLLTQNKETTR